MGWQGREQRKRIDALIKAWNDYPVEFRSELMLHWPDLFMATSRLVRYEEVRRARP